MKKLTVLILSLLIPAILIMPVAAIEAKTILKQTYTVSGMVEGAAGEALPNAVVRANGTQVIADDVGFYSMQLAAGSYTLTASASDYRSYSQLVNIRTRSGDITADFAGNKSLIPKAPDEAYVWDCIARWKAGEINLSKVLAVINAWKYPRI